MADWDTRFMELAIHVAGWSKDRSTKVGCVIVGDRNEVRALGYNGFPRGANDESDHRHERPLKYRWTEHAERNAIYNAAMSGVTTAGCRVYLPWFPCMDCARAIVQAGIVELIAIEPDMADPKWGEDFKEGLELFSECRVTVRFIKMDHPPATVGAWRQTCNGASRPQEHGHK